MTTDKKNKSIKPTLQFLLLCSAVMPPDQKGRVSFMGIFDKFLRTGVIPHFTIALGWKNGKGDFKFVVKLLDPDLKTKFTTPDISLSLKHEVNSGRIDLNIDGMNFDKPGVYWIEVVLEGKTIQSIPLPVEKGA